MHMYEYQCGKCGEIFEELVMSEDEVVPCPKCGSKETSKLLSRSGGCSGCSGGSCATCGGCH